MKKQASARNCFVCGVKNENGLGLKFYETSPGEVVAETIVPEHFQGYPGVVHGGIVAAMLDEAAGRVFVQNNPPRFMFTGKLSVRYRKPVPTGKLIRIMGHAREDRGRVATAVSEIYDSDNNLLANCEITLADIPPDLLGEITVNNEDWQVYADEEGS
jgi:uncharacterized protein (TIGR00369 family)